MTASVHVFTTFDAERAQLGRLLSATEAQQHLGINASTVRTWHQRRATSGLYAAGLLDGAPLFWEVDLLARKLGLNPRDADGERAHTLPELQEIGCRRKRPAEQTSSTPKTPRSGTSSRRLAS